jgi:hypothetical protein
VVKVRLGLPALGLRLALALPGLVQGLLQLRRVPGAAGDQADEGQEGDGRDAGHDRLVPPRPAPQSLPQRRPPGVNGLVFQETPEVVGQLLGRGVALLRVLGHRLEHDRFQLDRDGPVPAPRRGRFLEGDLAHDRLGVVAVVRGLQRQQLVERHAERIDVGAVVHGHPLGQGLLRTHVADRADQVAGHGHAGVTLHAGQAEVGDPQLAAPVDEQVGRLDVAMDDALVVGVLQRPGGLQAEVGGRAEKGRVPGGGAGGGYAGGKGPRPARRVRRRRQRGVQRGALDGRHLRASGLPLRRRGFRSVTPPPASFIRRIQPP